MSDDGPMGSIPPVDDDLSLPKATVQKLILGAGNYSDVLYPH
jgi:hypothetical protein